MMIKQLSKLLAITTLVATFNSCAATNFQYPKKNLKELSSCTIFQRATLSLQNRSENKNHQLYLINGVPATGLIYQPLVSQLQKTSKVPWDFHLVDLPGTGGSRLRDNKSSWTKQRQCISEYFEKIEEPFFLAIHDIAGPVILPLIKNYSYKIKGLIIFNTIIKPSKFKLIFPMSTLGTKFLGMGSLFAKSMPRFYFKYLFRKKGLARNDLVSEEQLNELYKEIKRNSGKSELASIIKGFEKTEHTDNLILEGLRAPIPKLIIWGDADPSLGKQYQYLSNSETALTELHHIKEGKHFLMMDFHEEISIIINKWIEKLGVN
jgi:pimeloyl-ACP methyl ester carboxylesterase